MAAGRAGLLLQSKCLAAVYETDREWLRGRLWLYGGKIRVGGVRHGLDFTLLWT